MLWWTISVEDMDNHSDGSFLLVAHKQVLWWTISVEYMDNNSDGSFVWLTQRQVLLLMIPMADTDDDRCVDGFTLADIKW